MISSASRSTAAAVWVFLPGFIGLLGATGRTHDLALHFLRIVVPSQPFLLVGMIGGAILRSHGDARRAMMATGWGAVAYAVLDPKRIDCAYPFKELTGCGVGFKLLQGFIQENDLDMEPLMDRIDLLAASIAADMVPIIDENRVLAYFGLQKLGTNPMWY